LATTHFFFKTAEGYNLDDVNGQNNWWSSLFGGNQSIENQLGTEKPKSRDGFSCVYIAQIPVEGRTESFKFSKN
jgi:hypothetical protein